MRIQKTEAREELSQKLGESSLDRNAPPSDPLCGMTGILLLELRNPHEDRSYRCAQWLFRTLLGEQWAVDDDAGMPEGFWSESIKFMKNRGYIVVDNPVNGDIVGYRERAQPHYMRHWGIYRDGYVESKFGPYSIYRHPVDLVPVGYGNDVIFFRKQ